MCAQTDSVALPQPSSPLPPHMRTHRCAWCRTATPRRAGVGCYEWCSCPPWLGATVHCRSNLGGRQPAAQLVHQVASAPRVRRVHRVAARVGGGGVPPGSIVSSQCVPLPPAVALVPSPSLAARAPRTALAHVALTRTHAPLHLNARDPRPTATQRTMRLPLPQEPRAPVGGRVRPGKRVDTAYQHHQRAFRHTV